MCVYSRQNPSDRRRRAFGRIRDKRKRSTGPKSMTFGGGWGGEGSRDRNGIGDLLDGERGAGRMYENRWARSWGGG